METSSGPNLGTLRRRLGKWVLCGLYLSALTALFTLVRWPAYSANLRDEEGHFANLLIHQPSGPNYLLTGRFYGKEVYQPAHHPAPNYELLRLTGFVVERLVDFNQLNDHRTTLLVRGIFSVFQLLFWLSMAVAVFVSADYWSSSSRVVLLTTIPLLATAPLAIDSSALLQIDSTAGILCIGTLCSILLLRVVCESGSALMNVLLFLSGMLVGLGRNEWSVALLATLGIVGALRFALPSQWERMGLNIRKDDAKILILLMLGCLVGNLMSYGFDALNWRGGWLLEAKRVQGQSLFSGKGLAKWLQATRSRMTDLAVVFALLLFSFWQILSRPKTIRLAQILVFGLAVCLLAIFFFSTASGSFIYLNRYFVPSFIASSASAIVLFPRAVTGTKQAGFAVAICILLAYNMLCYPRFSAYRPPRVSVRPGCLQILSTGVAYNRKDVDFIHNGTRVQRRALLAAKYGEPRCTP